MKKLLKTKNITISVPKTDSEISRGGIRGGIRNTNNDLTEEET